MSFSSEMRDPMAPPESPSWTSKSMDQSTLNNTTPPDTPEASTFIGDKEKQQTTSIELQASSRTLLRRAIVAFCKFVRNGRARPFGTGDDEPMPPPSPKVRGLNVFEEGYPNLAAYKDSDECFMLYRRYGYLQSRMLLERQDELQGLEEELDNFDLNNPNQLTSRENATDSRKKLFERIEKAYSGYASILTTAHSMMAFHRPSDSDYQSVRNYLHNIKPVHKDERAYIRYREDLVTLRPGREHAWLDRSIEHVLRKLHRPFPFINKWFCTESTRLKSRGGDEIYYSRERINLCASLIITLMILALLIVPIYLLYRLAVNTAGSFTGHATAICIGILLVFTLAFSAVLSLFTSAKRHEILGAAAAYCAVLVVFLGNVH